jgi:hypothetical protein
MTVVGLRGLMVTSINGQAIALGNAFNCKPYIRATATTVKIAIGPRRGCF